MVLLATFYIKLQKMAITRNQQQLAFGTHYLLGEASGLQKRACKDKIVALKLKLYVLLIGLW